MRWNPLLPLLRAVGLAPKEEEGAVACEGGVCRAQGAPPCCAAGAASGAAAATGSDAGPPAVAAGAVGAAGSEAALEALVSRHAAVVVGFGAAWCGPCKKMAPAFAEMAAGAGERAVFVKVDVDEAEGVAEARGVGPLPTYQAYVGGERVGECVGASEGKLRAMVEGALERAAARAAAKVD